MKNVRDIPPLNIQGAKIVKRNFAGRMEDYNREGNRYFTIRIDGCSGCVQRILSDEDLYVLR